MPNKDYVEFEIQGFVPPHDKLRLRTDGGMHSSGTATLGMTVDVECSDGQWAGGVIDHKELRQIRDAIDDHLARIDAMTDDERAKAGNPFGEDA